MDKTFTAQFIATAIQANCDRHLCGAANRTEWSMEQSRLWKLAADKMVASEVMRLVCPTLTPPSYAVRKQLREQTLKVGR